MYTQRNPLGTRSGADPVRRLNSVMRILRDTSTVPMEAVRLGIDVLVMAEMVNSSYRAIAYATDPMRCRSAAYGMEEAAA